MTPVNPGPSGGPEMTSPSGESNSVPDKDMDTGDPDPDMQYDVPTTNRFQILRIPIPDSKVYNVKKSTEVEKPPEIVIPFAPMTIVRPLIPAHHHYGIKNLNDGIHLYCNTVKQHKEMMDIFDKADVYLFTHPYKSDKSKRFVLYGLNTYPEDLIIKDLEEYGIKPTKVTNMTVKKQRYVDHATYLVYYPMDSQITLDIVKKAYVIRNTIVHWKHYAANGDGITTCSNCSQLGHSGHCTLPPKCGICSGAHVMSNCELLLNKRAYKRDSIATHLLVCPNCGDHHTVGYQQCETRLKYKENQAKRALRQQQRYQDAPKPTSNPWAPLPPVNRQHNRPPPNHHTTGNSQQNSQPAFNNPNYNTAPMPNHSHSHHNNHYSQHHNNNNNQNNNNLKSDKFSPGEVLELLNKIITCIDSCNTRAEQFKLMSNILSEHFIR